MNKLVKHLTFSENNTNRFLITDPSFFDYVKDDLPFEFKSDVRFLTVTNTRKSCAVGLHNENSLLSYRRIGKIVGARAGRLFDDCFSGALVLGEDVTDVSYIEEVIKDRCARNHTPVILLTLDEAVIDHFSKQDWLLVNLD